MTKEALEAAINSANIWSGRATLVLAIGILGEYVLLPFLKKGRWYESAAKIIFAILVVSGIAGEYEFSSQIAQKSAELQRLSDAEVAAANNEAANAKKDAESLRLDVARANERAAKADAETARLNKLAEDERAERLKLAQDVAERYFLFQAVWPKLKPFAGVKFVVWQVQDPEAERLARLIELTLRQISPLMIEENVNAFDEGVWLDFSSNERTEYEAVRTFAEILADYNIGALLSARSDLPAGTVRVRIHFKPDPKSNKVLLEQLVRTGPNQR